MLFNSSSDGNIGFLEISSKGASSFIITGNPSGISSVDFSLKIDLQILSSRDWKVITTALPSEFSISSASSNDFSKTVSSSFTATLKA